MFNQLQYTTATFSYEASRARNMYGPLQVLNPHAGAWFKDKFILEESEIQGHFDTREQWVLVHSPRTGEGVLFVLDRVIRNADNEIEVWIWKAVGGVNAELHVLND